MISLILRRPYVIDGELNKCLQCDEDKSGPIFKYESGRTRRNSGIKSEIDRPVDQIYNVSHCYYWYNLYLDYNSYNLFIYGVKQRIDKQKPIITCTKRSLNLNSSNTEIKLCQTS